MPCSAHCDVPFAAASLASLAVFAASRWAMMARMKAGRSSGVRDVIMFPSITTSASMNSAPALHTSSLMLQKLVTRLPASTFAETNSHAPAQSTHANAVAIAVATVTFVAHEERAHAECNATGEAGHSYRGRSPRPACRPLHNPG